MDIIGKSGTRIILTELLKKDKMYRKELSEATQLKGSLFQQRLVELKIIGLINDEMESKFGGKRYIWLTEKGKRVAKLLAEVKKILGEGWENKS